MHSNASGCWSTPTAAAPTGTAPGCGKPNSLPWPQHRPDHHRLSPCSTSGVRRTTMQRNPGQEPASGLRSRAVLSGVTAVTVDPNSLRLTLTLPSRAATRSWGCCHGPSSSLSSDGPNSSAQSRRCRPRQPVGPRCRPGVGCGKEGPWARPPDRTGHPRPPRHGRATGARCRRCRVGLADECGSVGAARAGTSPRLCSSAGTSHGIPSGVPPTHARPGR